VCFPKASPPPTPAPPPPPPPPPSDAANAPDPDALENARKRADAANKRTNRDKLRIPLGGGSGGSGLSLN
jgi:hypothetical protein